MAVVDQRNNKNALVDKFDINMALELYISEKSPGRRMQVWMELPLLRINLSGFKVFQRESQVNIT